MRPWADVAVVSIVFSSLLLGLIVGPQPVSVQVTPIGSVHDIEFLLDGQAVARVDAPGPFDAAVDFGRDLRPHEVEAIAHDAKGKEIGRVGRTVNLPQPPARLDLVVDRNAKGVPTRARIVATSTVRDAPVRRELTLDGGRLALDADGTAALPLLDLSMTHVLSGIAEFSEDAVARADVALGGGAEDRAGSGLTAVPVRVEQRLLPSTDSLKGRLTRRGEPLRVVAVERGRATVVIVRNPNSLEASRRFLPPKGADQLKLDDKDSVGFVWPVTKTIEGGSERTTLLESTPMMPGNKGGFWWLLTRAARSGGAEPPFLFADALAVAALKAQAEGTRRALVLVEGEERRDASAFAPSQVLGYLDRVGTPLHVWSLVPGSRSAWSADPENVSADAGLQAAVTRLKKDLGTQALIWVAGELNPTEVELAPPTPGIRLLARPDAR